MPAAHIETVKSAGKVALMHSLFLLCFANGMTYPFDHWFYPIVSTLLIATAVSAISLKAGVITSSILLWLIQIPGIVANAELLLLALYAITLTAWFVAAKLHAGPKPSIKLLVLYVLCFSAINVLYRFPHRLIFALILLAIGTLSYVVAALGMRWFGGTQTARALIGAVGITICTTWTAMLGSGFSVPVPLESAIVNTQRRVEAIVPAQRMPAGSRAVVPTESGWLNVLVKPSKRSFYWLALLDDSGAIKKPLLVLGERIEHMRRSRTNRHVWLVPSLNNRKLAAIDVPRWETVAASELTEPHFRVFLSPSGKIAATNNSDDTTPICVFHTDDMQLLTKIDLRLPNGELCESGAIVFTSDEHLFATCNGGYFYSIELTPNGEAVVLDSFKLPHGAMTEAMQVFDESRVIMIDLFFGTVAILDVPTRSVVRKRFVFPLLRVLKRVEALDLWCVASDLGFVFLLDDELNIKRTLYCGAKIKDIYVDGKRLYMASQAGIVEADLVELGLSIR